MRDRRDYLIAGFAAAFLFCLGLLVGQQSSVLPSVHAQDTGGFNPETPVNDASGNTPGSGVTITAPQPRIRPEARTVANNPTNSDSNNRFIAVTSPVGSGESVLFLIDSITEQVTVYRYRRSKGLEFLAGRKIHFDLKISGYQDISEFSYDEMRKLFDKQVAKAAADAAKNK